MKHSDEWLLRLSRSEIDEIDRAVAASRRLPIEDIRKADFPLSSLGRRLEALLDELIDGRGFALIRGLPMERYDLETAARAYWGIGSHLGGARSQNARGDLLGHVIDQGRSASDPSARLYQTSVRQNYHPDSTDVVGLLCLRKAMRGGASSILSSVTIYNEMQKRRPELAAELMQPLCMDRRGEVPPGKNPWFTMPIFNWHQGLLTTHFTRPYIDSAQRFPDVPRLTPAQVEALDFFQALCEDPDIHLNMDFEPGDMQFLQNYQTLHDRTAFEDWPDPARRRHLLRLWLCPSRGRELPPAYADRNDRLTIGDRGGILVAGAKPTVNLTVT